MSWESEKMFSWSSSFRISASKIIVFTDASNVEIGAVLEQEDQVVCYASWLLNNAEKNYSTYELECLAIIYGVSNSENIS